MLAGKGATMGDPCLSGHERPGDGQIFPLSPQSIISRKGGEHLPRCTEHAEHMGLPSFLKKTTKGTQVFLPPPKWWVLLRSDARASWDCGQPQPKNWGSCARRLVVGSTVEPPLLPKHPQTLGLDRAPRWPRRQVHASPRQSAEPP